MKNEEWFREDHEVKNWEFQLHEAKMANGAFPCWVNGSVRVFVMAFYLQAWSLMMNAWHENDDDFVKRRDAFRFCCFQNALDDFSCLEKPLGSLKFALCRLLLGCTLKSEKWREMSDHCDFCWGASPKSEVVFQSGRC